MLAQVLASFLLIVLLADPPCCCLAPSCREMLQGPVSCSVPGVQGRPRRHSDLGERSNRCNFKDFNVRCTLEQILCTP